MAEQVEDDNFHLVQESLSLLSNETKFHPVGDPLDLLPNELILTIINYLDERSLSRFRCTSRRFCHLVDSSHHARIRMQWVKIIYYAKNMLMIAEEFYNDFHYNQQEQHLKFFIQTLREILEDADLRSKSITLISTSYHRLCDNIVARFEKSNQIITNLFHSYLPDSNNLGLIIEMIDFYIRISNKEFNTMFPFSRKLITEVPMYFDDTFKRKFTRSQSLSLLPNHTKFDPVGDSLSLLPIQKSDSSPQLVNSSLIIQDKTARKIWIKTFGSTITCVDFDDFYQLLLVKYWPEVDGDSKFEESLRFFFNHHDYVTPYKWNVLINNFGPCYEFVQNFIQYGYAPVFLGTMNILSVETIFRHYFDPSINQYALRISRTYPDLLTITYQRKGRLSRIRHRRKLDTMPIKEFLNQIFNGQVWKPVKS
jgi:hypothetical protein